MGIPKEKFEKRYCDISLGIVSTALPNTRSGQGNVLKKILEAVIIRDYCVFSDASNLSEIDVCSNVSGRVISLADPDRRQSWFKQKVDQYFKWSTISLDREVFRRRDIITAEIRKHPVDALVACTASLTDIPAAFLASQEIGIPFFPYFFDDYVHQWRSPKQREFASKWEKRALPKAKAIFCPNETLAEDIEGRHGIKSVIIRNPIPLAKTVRVDKTKHNDNKSICIVYTGSVYDVQLDCFERLLEAGRLSDCTIELKIYSSQPPDVAPDIAKMSNVVWNGFVSQDIAIKAQSEADLLFLPLSFSESLAGVVRSAAPGKTGELLASRTPILAHAPKDSFLSTFLKKHNAAYVVDTPSAKEIASVLKCILEDKRKMEEIVENAYALSAEFSIEKAAEIFMSTLTKG